MKIFANIVVGGFTAAVIGAIPSIGLWLWIYVREGRIADLLGYVAFACLAAMLGFFLGAADTLRKQ